MRAKPVRKIYQNFSFITRHFSEHLIKLNISEPIKQKLTQEFETLCPHACDPYENPVHASKIAASLITKNFEEQDVEAIRSFHTSDKSILLIENGSLPSHIMPTPYNDRKLYKTQGHVAELYILGLLYLMNSTALVFGDEKGGHLVQNIFSITQNAISSAGSKLTFGAHSESAHCPKQIIDVLSLYCLRGNNRAATIYWPLQELIKALQKETIDILKEPFFEFKTGDSYDINQGAIGPVLFDRDGKLNVRLNTAPGRMRLLNDDARKAFLDMNRYFDDPRNLHKVYLKSGDFLSIKNKEALHGRLGFKDAEGGDRRWLFRMYSVFDTFFEKVYRDADNDHNTDLIEMLEKYAKPELLEEVGNTQKPSSCVSTSPQNARCICDKNPKRLR